jgi:septal ring factor EnvC (AmiA/AmiB activator)
VPLLSAAAQALEQGIDTTAAAAAAASGTILQLRAQANDLQQAVAAAESRCAAAEAKAAAQQAAAAEQLAQASSQVHRYKVQTLPSFWRLGSGCYGSQFPRLNVL